MPRIFLYAFLGLALATAAYGASPSPEVRLILDETSVLPGTPTGLSVIVTNPGDGQLNVPDRLWLTAKNEAGESYTIAASSATDGMAKSVPPDVTTIPPATSREIRFDPAVFVAESPWFVDGRLSAPGHYRLRAVFAAQVQRDGTFDASTAFASKEELLTVAVQSDDDAAVWRWMQQKAGANWGTRQWLKYYAEFGDFVVRNHLRSHYTLYAAVFQRHGHGEAPPLLEDQVRLYPKNSFTDQAKLLLVQIHQQAITGARRQSQIDQAADEAKAARTLATELMRDSKSSTVRATAKALFERTPSPEQLRSKPRAN